MLADSTQIAASLVVEDIVKKKYRNVEPRPAHLKPPLAESPFGMFPASYHMRDTWSGNKSCRYRDRTPDIVTKASKDPISYVNRPLPSRLLPKPKPKVMPKHLKLSMAETLNGSKPSPAPSATTLSPTRGVTKKKYAPPPEELPQHLKSNFSVTGSSKIWKAPPRPLTAPERREQREKTEKREQKIGELTRVDSYMKLTGKFWIDPKKLATGSARPLTAPPIRAARAALERAPKVPRAGAFRKRAIEATLFRKYYERGDLPVNIDHCSGGNKVLWKVDVRKLDYHVYLPIFVDGLREVDDPYRFLSIQGVIDMIQAAPEKLLPVVPQLILPINAALATREPDIICSVMKILQQMILQVSQRVEAKESL